MSDRSDVADDIERTFGDLRRRFSIAEDEDTDDVPPSPASLEPPSPVTPADVVDEDENYPGSRHRRSALVEHRTEPSEDHDVGEGWDDSPMTFVVRGKPVEFFTIGALARALNRKPGTVRKWEQRGFIPASRYRSPSEDPKGQRRLYTRSQVEGVLAIAREEGLLDPARKKRMDQTRFPERVRLLFAKLEERS